MSQKWPVRLVDEVPGEVLVFAHASEEEAKHSAKANREFYGHPSHHEQRIIWVTVVDIRPALAELKEGQNEDHQH